MPAGPHVIVLGAGIMGTCTALFLARRGATVTLVDRAPQPLSQASRWNEGKIHLGHLYAADPSLGTARRVLPGGLAFKPLVEELTGCPLDDVVTTHDDTYLVHRDSIVPAAEVEAYLQAVTALAAGMPGAGRYFVDLSAAGVRPLSPGDLAAEYDPGRVVAGFRVPERSVDTVAVADRLAAALKSEPGIEQMMATRATSVRPARGRRDGLEVVTDGGNVGPGDYVVNASWEGRPALDASVGLPTPGPWTHRYRLALFVTTPRPVALGSAVLVTGPYGDVKAYSRHHFYASWYPAGLQAEGTGVEPPVVPELSREVLARVREETFAGLGGCIPAVRELAGPGADVRVAGGWVFAVGGGRLDDPAATLHRRDRLGVQTGGRYLSVDTGKYSTAPWLAQQVAEAIVPR